MVLIRVTSEVKICNYESCAKTAATDTVTMTALLPMNTREICTESSVTTDLGVVMSSAHILSESSFTFPLDIRNKVNTASRAVVTGSHGTLVPSDED